MDEKKAIEIIKRYQNYLTQTQATYFPTDKTTILKS